MEKKGVYKNSVSSAPPAALKTPPVPVIFPDLSRKIDLRCRALLEDRIFVIDVRINFSTTSNSIYTLFANRRLCCILSSTSFPQPNVEHMLSSSIPSHLNAPPRGGQERLSEPVVSTVALTVIISPDTLIPREIFYAIHWLFRKVAWALVSSSSVSSVSCAHEISYQERYSAKAPLLQFEYPGVQVWAYPIFWVRSAPYVSEYVDQSLQLLGHIMTLLWAIRLLAPDRNGLYWSILLAWRMVSLVER